MSFVFGLRAVPQLGTNSGALASATCFERANDSPTTAWRHSSNEAGEFDTADDAHWLLPGAPNV